MAVFDAFAKWRIVRAVAPSTILLAACSTSSGPGPTTAGTDPAAAEAMFPGCKLPPQVAITQVDNGCYAHPAVVCEVPNGATIEPDGGLADGATASCIDVCPASTYSLLCTSGSPNESPPSPNAALGCGPGGPIGYSMTGWNQCCPCQ